jgi:hypothetical protein
VVWNDDPEDDADAILYCQSCADAVCHMCRCEFTPDGPAARSSDDPHVCRECAMETPEGQAFLERTEADYQRTVD